MEIVVEMLDVTNTAVPVTHQMTAARNMRVTMMTVQWKIQNLYTIFRKGTIIFFCP
jgi:hypothetical protein